MGDTCQVSEEISLHLITNILKRCHLPDQSIIKLNMAEQNKTKLCKNYIHITYTGVRSEKICDKYEHNLNICKYIEEVNMWPRIVCAVAAIIISVGMIAIPFCLICMDSKKVSFFQL